MKRHCQEKMGLMKLSFVRQAKYGAGSSIEIRGAGTRLWPVVLSQSQDVTTLVVAKCCQVSKC